MSPRAEFFFGLFAANPSLLVVIFISFFLCASVFVGASLFQNKAAHVRAASLPLQDDENIFGNGGPQA